MQILLLETQWQHHVTHAPPTWTTSDKLQAQFLLYSQTAAVKHTFLKHYTQFSAFGTIFLKKSSYFHKEHAVIQNSKVNCPTVHTDLSPGQTPVAQFYN